MHVRSCKPACKLTKHFCRSCRLTFPREIEYGLSRLESNKEANLPDSIEFSRARATILHVDALALDSETRENTSRLSPLSSATSVPPDRRSTCGSSRDRGAGRIFIVGAVPGDLVIILEMLQTAHGELNGRLHDHRKCWPAACRMQEAPQIHSWIRATCIVSPGEAGLAYAGSAFSLWMFASFRECAASSDKEFHRPIWGSGRIVAFPSGTSR